MRRKSERTVKTSPIKKPETPSRRSTRRGRKSPEKAINEEDSENSSDVSSSDHEEVVAPKRTRRTSRTIEKSSSADEVKATTTTRSRRRTVAKKGDDIPEEESTEPEQITSEAQNEPEHAELPTEHANVDSSTEPTTSTSQPETSNNVKEDEVDEEPARAVHENEPEQERTEEQPTNDVEVIEAAVEEPAEVSKPKRRSLKRLERVISDDADENVPETTETDAKQEDTPVETSDNTTNVVEKRIRSPIKPPAEEVTESDEPKATDENEATPSSAELQNGNNVSDVADTTAKDTAAGDTDKLTKKKPLIRKRKWLTNKTSAPKVQEIAISTDSLKGLISDVKPVPLSDVKLDSSPEDDHEPDDVKVVSSTSVDYSEERKARESIEENLVASISTSRKVSVVTESEGEQPLSPAKHTPSNILYITNLVRPFTVLQLKCLLQRTGRIAAEDGFWIDKIKSRCFVKYETEDEASETRHALHGVKWPSSNPKCLNVDFGTENVMLKAIDSTANDVKPNMLSRDDRIVSSNELHDTNRERAAAVDRPVREWDLGKKDSTRPRDTDRSERDKEREPKTSRDAGRENERERERDRDRDRMDRRRRSASASPSRKFAKNEPPLRLLDDLFRKTKTTPCIYWLPLTPEQIAIRGEERKKVMERREAMRKEREREEAEERNRRREREKRRDDSRERRDRDRPREERDSGKRRRY